MLTPKSAAISSVPNWYAIHAKPAREALAQANVRALGVEVFLPFARRERKPVKPLFPGYLFARFTPALHLDWIRYAQGVLQVVSTGRFPLPIAEHVIEDLRASLDESGCLPMAGEKFLPGDRVVISAGPLQGLTARVTAEQDGRRRVTILLETILQARVCVSRDCLSALPEAA